MGGGPREKGFDAPAMGSGLAIVTLLKGLIGAGLLGLPKAFGKVGLGLAVPGCAVLAVLNVLGVMKLIDTNLILDKRQAEPSDDEGSTTSASESTSDLDSNDYGLGLVAIAGRKLFGTVGIILAALAVLGTQLGIALAYVVFIHVTLIETVWFRDQNEMIIRVVCCIIFCALSMLRKLNSLAMLSVVALAAYVFIVLDLAHRGWEPVTKSTNIAFGDAWAVTPEGLHSWFGSTVFAYEGIVLAQYVFEDMRLNTVKAFMPVLSAGYGSGCILFILVGAYGYMAYGDKTRVPIYLDFTRGAPTTVADELLLVSILFMSFALQMFPVFSCVDSLGIGQKHPGDDITSDDSSDEETIPHRPHHTIGKVLLDKCLRIVVVVLLCLVAAVLPKPECVTDLVGDVFMSLMAFILPGALHLAAKKRSLTAWDIVVDVLLILLGCTALVGGLLGTPACFAGSD